MKRICFSAFDDKHITVLVEAGAEPISTRSYNCFSSTLTVEVLAPSTDPKAPWDRLFVVATRIDRLPGKHLLWAFGVAPAFDCQIPPWPISYRTSQASDYRTHSSVMMLEVPDDATFEI
jgi:hypothetical protein